MLVWINKGSTKGFNKIVKNNEYILAYAKNVDKVKSYFGENSPDMLDELEHYCFNKPNPGNPICNVLFKKGCRIEGIKNIEFTNEVGFEVKLKIVEGKMIFQNGILQNDIVLRGAFPYRNQIENYFRNLENGIPTFDYKGQKWAEIFFNSRGMPRYRKERNTKIISSIIDEANIPNYGSDDISSLFGLKEIFQFPKPKELILHLLKYFSPKNSITLDFFSGSSTTAHAVMEQNVKDKGIRKYIMVQLPEECSEDSEAYKSGFINICEIGKERIRRAGQKIKQESGLEGQNLDIGFRVLKLDSTNMKDVYYSSGEYNQEMLLGLESNIKEDRNDLDLLFGVLLDWGVSLSLPHTFERIDGKKIHFVNDSDLVACFEENINESLVRDIAKRKPLRVVFRDSSFGSSPDKINVSEIFKTISPDTTIKVI